MYVSRVVLVALRRFGIVRERTGSVTEAFSACTDTRKGHKLMYVYVLDPHGGGGK